MNNRIVMILFVFGSVLLLSANLFAQAEETFKAQCSSCHGDGGGGSPAGKKLGVPDLRSSQVQNRSDDELFQTIAHGVGHKQYPHVFLSRGLSAKQIVDLVALIRTMPKHK